MDKGKALERLNKAIEYLKDNGQARNQTDMATLMGIRQPHLAAAINGDYKRLTEGLLKKFAAAYSDYIFEDWLLTGEGQMAKPLQELRPHYEQTVAAGGNSAGSMGESDDTLRPIIPWFPDYDCTVKAHGRSMEPKIENGDILACRRLTDRSNPPIGKICVIVNTEGNAVVKEIVDTTEEGIILHSLNNSPGYDDYEMRFDILREIYLVVGSVRNF